MSDCTTCFYNGFVFEKCPCSDCSNPQHRRDYWRKKEVLNTENVYLNDYGELIALEDIPEGGFIRINVETYNKWMYSLRRARVER